MCGDFPDVGYCMLSESITSLSLMAAQQPVSFFFFALFFCLVVVKCRSKHEGERKLIIAFDTCCEAEQLFVTGGQLLSSLTFLLQTSTDLPFQPLIKEIIVSMTPWEDTNLCGLLFFYVFCFYFFNLKQHLKEIKLTSRSKTTPSVSPSQGVETLPNYVSLSHAIMLLESPFLKRGSDHLRFPVFTLRSRRLEHSGV